MAYSQNFPAQRPSFMFDASNAGRIPPNMNYSRASSGTFFGTEKVLSSENLLLQSQDFDTTWVTSGIASVTGSQAAPDGTSTAWTLTPSTGATGHLIQQDISITPNNEYTAVAHIKAGAATHGWIVLRSEYLTYCYAQLEFSTATLTTGGVSWTGVTGTKTELGNGWYKITLTGTAPSSATSPNFRIGINDGTAFNASGYPAWTPAGTETLLAWGAQVNTTGATVYDSPTTTQISRSYQTKLQTAASGAARFEHSATDGQSMGILVEGQSQNLIARSDSIDNAYWTKSNCTVTAAAAVGVTGALNACLITESEEVSPATNVHSVYSSSFGLSSATSCTLSVYCKAAGVNRVQLLSTVGGSSRNVNFNIANGTVISESSATGAVEAVGDGVYRISITYTASATTNGRVYLILLNDSDASDYTGNGYNSVITSGFQFEQNSFASSLITSDSGSQTTRAADSLSMTDSSLFDNGGGTLYAEASQNVQNTYNGIFSVDDGTGSNIVQMFGNTSNFRAEISSGGTTVANMTAAGNSVNTFHKHCVSFSPSEAKYFVNGLQIGSTDTDLNIPTMSQIHLGELNTSGNHLNGHIKRVAVYSEPVSSTNAAALTS